jgi:predicted alpha/beta-hydrolase family hydrolase
VPAKLQKSFAVPLPAGGSVTAIAYAAKAPIATLVLGHGAGADQRHAFMVGIARRFAARDVETVTYNFPYTEAGRRAPDRAATLEACTRAVVSAVRKRAKGRCLFLGGKSMGGRIASQVAAEDAQGLAGLVFLGYPLHPPGKPEQLRAVHLPKVKAPMCFVQGARDAFGTPAELKPILAKLKGRARLYVVEEGDHSFAVPKRLGRTPDAIADAVADLVVAWIREVG